MYAIGIAMVLARNKQNMSTTANKRWSRYDLSVLLVITLGIFLRFFLLTNQSLWLDEGWSLFNSDAATLQESISKVREGVTHSDKFQPLYYVVLFLWRQAFGDTEFALRSLSALLGVGTLVVIFFTALRIYGKKHALWSSLILATSSFCVDYSQQVRSYALLMFIASLQLYFFSKALDRDEGHEGFSRWFFWIFTAIGLFGNISMVLFSTALCLSHILIDRNLRNWLKWWLPAALFSFPIVLYYITLPSATDPTNIQVSRSGFPIIQNALFVLYGLLVGTTYGPSMEQLRGDDRVQVVLHYWSHLLLLLIVSIVIFYSLLRAILKNNKSKYQRADRLLVSLLVTSFLFSLIFAIVTKINWVPRHSFYIWLPLAIVLPSSFIQTNPIKLRYKVSRYARIAVIFLLIMNIYSLFNYYFNKDYWKDDYRSVAQYLIKNQAPSTPSIFLYGSHRLLQYYGDTSTLQEWELTQTLEKKNFTEFAQKVRNITKNADEVVLVINREYLFAPKGLIAREMGKLYKLNSRVNFNYFTLYRFQSKVRN